jgi:toxin ParE1/3/4
VAQYRLTDEARRDIIVILAWSEERHGEKGRLRYDRLIKTALRDLAADPDRRGARERPEIGPGIFTYHLRQSRERARALGGHVRQPRHLILGRRSSPEAFIVLRVLHDAMDVGRHAPSAANDGPPD